LAVELVILRDRAISHLLAGAFTNLLQVGQITHFSSYENQPRRNELASIFLHSFFVFFVSSWLIFIVTRRRSLRHERLLRKIAWSSTFSLPLWSARKWKSHAKA